MRIRFFLLSGGLVLNACVGDSTPAVDGGNDASIDVTSTDGGSPEACATISNQPGVDCFAGGRCTPETQQCCVGLTGQGLIGQCGDASATACGTQPYFETWACDKGFDCPANAAKCCAGQEATATLFTGLSSGACPIQLHVEVGDAGPDAFSAPFTIASCQTSCANAQLCATDSECGDAGLHCVPAEFTQSSNSKTFGVCLP
jgi:hypothetical protein